MPRKLHSKKSSTEKRKQQIIKNANDAAYHGSPCPSQEKLKMKYNKDEAQLYRETYQTLAVYIHDFPIRKAHRAAQLRVANGLDCPTRGELSKEFTDEQIEAYLRSYEKSHSNRRQKARAAEQQSVLPKRQYKKVKSNTQNQLSKDQAGEYRNGYQWTIKSNQPTKYTSIASKKRESIYSSEQLAHLQSLLEAPIESESLFNNQLQTWQVMTHNGMKSLIKNSSNY